MTVVKHNVATSDIEATDVQQEQFFLEEKATKRLLRKIDSVLLPVFALLYLLSFLDRANIGNARLAGLEADLGMTGLEYNYILSEIPSNLLKKLRPSIWIPSIMVAWSICTTLMGIVDNLAGLIATRVALGLAEGRLFPGVAFCITMWYKREEVGLRMALIYLQQLWPVLSAACSRVASWRWTALLVSMGGPGFSIIEDLITFMFLTPIEKEDVIRRLAEDRGALSNDFDIKYFYYAVSDWKIWAHVVITVGNFTSLYCISLFLPTIVRTLGYRNETAQLMTVPPYAIACVFCIGGGWLADRLQTRGIFMIGFLSTALMGMIMVLASTNSNVKYAGCIFAATGIYADVPQCITWNSGNIGGAVKRSVGIAMHCQSDISRQTFATQNPSGNVGGIIASFIFLPKDAPRYIPGLSILVAFLNMSLIGSILMTIYLRRENAHRDAMHRSPAEYTMAEKELERERGRSRSRSSDIRLQRGKRLAFEVVWNHSIYPSSVCSTQTSVQPVDGELQNAANTYVYCRLPWCSTFDTVPHLKV